MNIPTRPIVCSLLLLCFLLFASSCGTQDNTDEEPATESKKSSQPSSLNTLDAVDAIEIVESPSTGVALGWGWNRGDSEPIPTICIEFVPGEEPAQTRYMTMHEATDSYELMESLGLSAEASVKAIGFEGSGKAAFAKSQNITSSKTVFVLNATVQNGVRYASPVPESEAAEGYQPVVNERGGSRGAIRLTPEALKLAQKNDPSAFKRMCGSSFVSAIYGGAKLTATLSFTSRSKSQKEKLQAEMSGSGWGARFKAKVQKAKTENSSSDRMDISIFQTGGKGDAIPVSKEDLIAKLETISMDAYVAPKDFQIAITPYEILSNWPGKMLPDKETEFDELASYWGAYNTLYDEIQHILNEPERYIAWQVDRDGKIAMSQDSCQVEQRAVENSNKKLDDLTPVGFAAHVLNFESPQYKAAQNEYTEKIKELKVCREKPPSVELQHSRVDLLQLRRAQDEILIGLRSMEEEARICSDKSDACTFNAADYRSPYAFRIQLPIPVDSGVISIDDIVAYNVSRIAKGRCQISSNNIGCLSNTDISGWAQKLGLVSVNKEFQPELFKKNHNSAVKRSPSLKLLPIKAGMAVFEENRQDVLWYNPHTQKDNNVSTKKTDKK